MLMRLCETLGYTRADGTMATDITFIDVILLKTYEDRLALLSQNGTPFSFNEDLSNTLKERFYRSKRWKRIRNKVINRDNGCDLAVPGMRIHGRIIIHHIVPITNEDILHNTPILTDMDNLICTSHATHNHIHYGTTPMKIITRYPGDTKEW